MVATKIRHLGAKTYSTKIYSRLFCKTRQKAKKMTQSIMVRRFLPRVLSIMTAMATPKVSKNRIQKMMMPLMISDVNFIMGFALLFPFGKNLPLLQ